MKRLLLGLLILLLSVAPADAMLAKYYRLHCYWVADQTLTYNSDARIAIRMVPWKITTAGALEYGTVDVENTVFLNTGETLATGNSVEGDVNDNTSNLYWGVKAYLEVTADVTSTDGTMYVYLEENDTSTDPGTWPSDQADFDVTKDCKLVCAMEMSTDAVDEDRGKNFEF